MKKWFGKFSKKKESNFTREVIKISSNLDEINRELEDLTSFEIQEKYQGIFKYLWGEYWNENIPQTGASQILQAELLRRIEKIQWENQKNGNINWDESFDYFCDFLLENFFEFSFLSTYMGNAQLILKKFKKMGRYAQLIQSEEFLDEYFDVEKVAYVDENFYDYLFEMICVIYENHPENIPFEPEKGLKR